MDALTPLMSHIGNQFLNCLEGLMYYCLKTRDLDTNTVAIITRLFNHHKKCTEEIIVCDRQHIFGAWKILQFYLLLF